MAKEKVNYQEVHDLYQLCCETKDLREFCADYGVNCDKFMNWLRHQLWSEKLWKTVQVEQPKVAKVQAAGHPMRQSCSWNILWESCPLTDIRFTECMMEKTQRCFI